MQQSNSLSYKLFFTFSLLVFLVFVFYRIVFIYYPHPSAAGTDNNVVYFIQRLLDGGALYTDPAQSPYSVAQYGPLYYCLAAGICRIMGITPENVLGIFETSKIICLFLNGMLATVLFFTGRRIFNFPLHKSLFLALVTFIFIEGNSFARPDSLEHLFFFLSSYFFMSALKKQELAKINTVDLILGAAFAVFAIFSKQSAITLLLIALLWLTRKKVNRKGLLIYAGSFIAVLAGLLLYFEMTSGIKNMYLNIVLGLDNGIHWGTYWRDIIVNFYSWYGCLWVVSFIFIYTLLRKETRPLLQYFCLALFLQFLLTNLFALKFGSTSNYFTNWWTMLFVAIAFYWDRLEAMARGIHKNLTIALLFFLLLLKMGLVVQPAVEKLRNRDQQLAFYAMEKRVADHILSLHGSTGKLNVFCNLFSPDSYLNNFLFREALVPQYDIVSLASYPKHVYDYTNLRNELANGTVPYIITKAIQQPLRFMDIDLSHYELSETIGGYYLYKYKGL